MEMKIKLKPFQIPNFILTAKGNSEVYEGPKFALSEVDSETLDMLCEKFRADVFSRAGKADPRKVEPVCQV